MWKQKRQSPKNPAFFFVKLGVHLLFKLLSRSPESKQPRTKKEHGRGLGDGRVTVDRHLGDVEAEELAVGVKSTENDKRRRRPIRGEPI